MVSRQINILYIIDFFREVGGTERHLSHLVLNLPRDLFNCRVVVFDLAPNVLVDRMRSAGIPVTHLPVGREYTLNALRRARELSRIIKENDIHIVQTYHQKADTFGALVASLSGARHIVSSKRDMGLYRKPWHIALNKALGSLFDGVIVVADAVGELIASKDRIPRSRITRIYNGVDAAEFSPPSEAQRTIERTRLGFGEEDFVVGMVANFRKEKNYDVFFEGAAKALNEIPSLKLLAVGDGPLFHKFRTQCANDAIGTRVVFTGAATDVARYLSAMDAGCLIPGNNEGFSNSVLEKMAVGLPLIVSNVGGNAEAVIDRQNGLVIEPDDVEGFANALVAIHDDPVMRKRMGLKSRELVEQRYTLEQMCKAHETFYLSLVKNGA